jgi:8-oxo-dGTP pyrophosphatase MutT (NUDIX family)
MPKEIKDLRQAAYIIPVRKKNGQKQVAIIEYEPGAYGTIGGRYEDGETVARDVLRRELTEELNQGASFMADIAVEIPEPYKFKVEPHRVAFRSARNEAHMFFLAEISEQEDIRFCEKCQGDVKIVWLDSEALVDDKIIGWPDQREYFEKYVMPIIRNL